MAKDKVIALQATDAFSITPHDTNTISTITSGAHTQCVLYIGTSGNINVVTSEGTTIVFTNVPVGFFPVVVKQVKSTSTTASGIIGLVSKYGIEGNR